MLMQKIRNRRKYAVRFLIPFLLVNIANLVITSSVAHASELGNMMPLGDSITYGMGVDGGYRDPLYQLLSNAGHTFTFVGTASGQPTTLLTNNGQQNHEGHSGYIIKEVNTSIRSGIFDNLDTYLGATNPDIILLMIGTNDVNNDIELATAPDRLSDLLTKIDTLKPNAHTIVANIIPVQATSGTLFDRVADYNAAVPGVVTTHQGLGHKVSFLDMHSFLSAPGDLADSLHPNAGGYAKMAEGWETGINAIPEPCTGTLATPCLLFLLGRRRLRSVHNNHRGGRY